MNMEKEEFDLELDRLTANKWQIVGRLYRYALSYKAPLFLALVMLLIAVATDLTGPFIAKRMIDVHIAGIDQQWYETEAAGHYAVEYDGAMYKRDDRFGAGETRGREVRIVQVERSFYFVEEGIEVRGTRRIAADGSLVFERGDEEVSYPAEELSAEALFGFFQPEWRGILQLSALYFVLIVISAIFTYGQRYLLQASSNRIIQRMRMDVFSQMNRLPIRYFDNLPAGKVVSRITNDTETIRDLYVNVLANFFTGVVYLLGILTALFLLDTRFAVICLVIIPILVVWVWLYGKYAKQLNRVIRGTVSEINGRINESIQGMSVIKAFRKEREVEAELEHQNMKLFTYQSRLLSLDARTGHNLVGALRNLSFVALVWYFGGVSLTSPEGVFTLGVLYAFVDFLSRLFQPVANIVTQLPNLEKALVSAGRVFVLMDEQGEDVSNVRMPRYRGDVKFEDVWFAYNAEEYVLKGVTVEAKQGQTVAIVGHTGSGKSSLINVLFRFYDPQRGRITIDGMDTREMPRQMMREHMGIVLQDPFLFSGTIASNVSLGDPSISREQVERALLDVGGESMLKQLRRGMDEPVMEKGSTLSAGQRQLISFARALAFNPAILILDEATSNIDTETEQVIQQALEVVKAGRTTFVIAHRLSTVKSADMILVMDHGEIVERGDHATLMAKGGKYDQMYKLQRGGLIG